MQMNGCFNLLDDLAYRSISIFKINGYVHSDARKPVCGVSDQARLKPVCIYTESGSRLGILGTETKDLHIHCNAV